MSKHKPAKLRRLKAKTAKRREYRIRRRARAIPTQAETSADQGGEA